MNGCRCEETRRREALPSKPLHGHAEVLCPGTHRTDFHKWGQDGSDVAHLWVLLSPVGEEGPHSTGNAVVSMHNAPQALVFEHLVPRWWCSLEK